MRSTKKPMLYLKWSTTRSVHSLLLKSKVLCFGSVLSSLHTGHVHAARAAGPRAMKQQGRPRGSSRSGMHRPESLKSQRVKLNDLEVDSVM